MKEHSCHANARTSAYAAAAITLSAALPCYASNPEPLFHLLIGLPASALLLCFAYVLYNSIRMRRVRRSARVISLILQPLAAIVSGGVALFMVSTSDPDNPVLAVEFLAMGSIAAAFVFGYQKAIKPPKH